ncbi:PAS domain-containing sensor histidine kinase [Haloarcula regularis]|uniref:PAS domain-containing sensor histidine kinase n=1 Tax=Haloarcula regularis TaxID=3033392 RepID=UPI0023E7ACE7|nr:PAS domain-containing sensor histidine kinase [Halomicroarcula sp. SYNS111]
MGPEDAAAPIAGDDLESVLSRVDDAVFIFSVERDQGEVSFRFQWNNAAHEAITGMTVAEYGGLHPEEYLGEEMGAEVTANYLECVERRDTIVYEETLVHEHGQVRWHTKLTPVIEDDRVVQIIGVSRDITDRMARSKHLRVVDRVFRHNVRNIVNVIVGQAEYVAATAEPPVANGATQIVDSSEDLLETSQKAHQRTEIILEESPVKPIRIDLLLEEALSEVSSMARDAAISVTSPRPVAVEASPRLSDAVVELVQNAVVHHDRGSPSIEVDVRIQDSTVELEVRDDGPGIPETERKILVEGRPPRGLAHGIGLGMWMVYWIVQRSNGDISVSDREPRGSAVTMCLPRRLEDPASRPES